MKETTYRIEAWIEDRFEVITGHTCPGYYGGETIRPFRTKQEALEYANRRLPVLDGPMACCFKIVECVMTYTPITPNLEPKKHKRYDAKSVTDGSKSAAMSKGWGVWRAYLDRLQGKSNAVYSRLKPFIWEEMGHYNSAYHSGQTCTLP